jgi:hypothetical protein
MNMQPLARVVKRATGHGPRGAWAGEVVLGLCRDLELVHAVDPFIRPSLTPGLTYWRLHGNGSHYATYTDGAGAGE